MAKNKKTENLCSERLEYMAHNAKKVAELIKNSGSCGNKFLVKDLDMLIGVIQEDFDFVKNNMPL